MRLRKSLFPEPERSLPNQKRQNEMIPRTLEPESMDSEKEVDEYENMDHSAVNLQFVDDLFVGKVGPQVIDLGCGPGAIAVLVAQRDLSFQVMAVDSATSMLDAARMEIELGGVLGQVQLEHADAKSLVEFSDAMADTVISNSLIHHIAEPRSVLKNAIRLLRPGGRIFIRDLYRPADSEEVERLVSLYCGEETEYAQQLFRQSLHAALTLDEVREVAGGFGILDLHVQMTSDRHWTIDWTRPDSAAND